MEEIKDLKFCGHCGEVITEGRFCDNYCRQEFYSEINKDGNFHLEGLKASTLSD